MSDEEKKAVESLCGELKTHMEKQYRHNRYMSKKLRLVQANLDTVVSAYQDQGKAIGILEQKQHSEMDALKAQVAQRDRKISNLENKAVSASKEDTDRFIDWSKALGSINTGLSAMKEKVEDIHVKMVTKEVCEASRAACPGSQRRKPWYESIPILVSAATLLVMLVGACVWFIRGPASIDPKTAERIRLLLDKENNRDAILLKIDTKLAAKKEHKEPGKK